MNRRQNLKQEKGITIVALITTIIVLVILAAVTINAVFNSGIINTAVNGTVDYAEAQNEEKVEFNELDQNIQDRVKKVSTSNSTTDWDTTKVDLVKSADGIIVPVPKGFVASKAEGENTVEDGFVIYQGEEDVTDVNLNEAMMTRNQFVWVPVPDTNTMFATYNGKAVGRLYDFGDRRYAKKNTALQWNIKGFREPDVVTGDGTKYDADVSNYASLGLTTNAGESVTTLDKFTEMLEEDFADMKTSVERYHGFYIGRYQTGEGEKVVQGVNPLGNKTWYEHYKISKDMVNLNGIKSGIIWGSQVDQTVIWLITQGGEKEEYVYNTNGKGHTRKTNNHRFKYRLCSKQYL